jgi:multidrug resistance efflux pump
MGNMAVQAWLEHTVSKRGGVTSALLVLGTREQPGAPSYWPADCPPDNHLLAAAQSRLPASSLDWPTAPAAHGIVMQAVRSEGKVVGTLAMRLADAPLAAPLPAAPMAMPEPSPASASASTPSGMPPSTAATVVPAAPAAIAVDTAAAATAATADTAPAAATAPVAAPARTVVELSGIGDQSIRLIGVALAQSRLDRCAAALATELASTFGCRRVFVGLSTRGFVRVEGLSHGSGAGRAHALARLVGAAMDESLDQGASICHPQHPDDRPRVTLAHAELAASGAGLCVLTVPMFCDGEPAGALTFERDQANRFDAPTIQRLETIGTTLAPVLLLKASNERSAWQRLRAGALFDSRALSRPQRMALTLGAVTLAGLLVAALIVPTGFQVAAPVHLEGRVQRAVVAPSDGFLKSAQVRAGDLVKEGQVLAELNDDDLRLERRRWETEVARYENSYAEAQAKQDRTQLVMADARVAESRAQLNLVEQQIARTRLLAPFDGLVIKGELTQQLGAPVKRGDLLLTLTPSRELRVMLEIDERDVASVQAGSRGALTLSALPDRRLPFVIDRVMPVARSDAGRNLFEAEAHLGDMSEPVLAALRPGLQGVARIDAGERPLYWQLGHRALDWARLQWWAWLG